MYYNTKVLLSTTLLFRPLKWPRGLVSAYLVSSEEWTEAVRGKANVLQMLLTTSPSSSFCCTYWLLVQSFKIFLLTCKASLPFWPPSVILHSLQCELLLSWPPLHPSIANLNTTAMKAFQLPGSRALECPRHTNQMSRVTAVLHKTSQNTSSHHSVQVILWLSPAPLCNLPHTVLCFCAASGLSSCACVNDNRLLLYFILCTLVIICTLVTVGQSNKMHLSYYYCYY